MSVSPSIIKHLQKMIKDKKSRQEMMDWLESISVKNPVSYLNAVYGIKEQTGAGAAGATTTATFTPAVGPAGSASKSGSFPGGNTKRRRKIERRDPPSIKEAIRFSNRLGRSSMGK